MADEIREAYVPMDTAERMDRLELLVDDVGDAMEGDAETVMALVRLGGEVQVWLECLVAEHV